MCLGAGTRLRYFVTLTGRRRHAALAILGRVAGNNLNGSSHPSPSNPCAGRSLIGDQGLAREDMEPIIAGRDLRKSWGATLVLEHADFLLHAGDKVALVGP